MFFDLEHKIFRCSNLVYALLFPFILMVQPSSAQKIRRHELGFQVGGAYYIGDLNQQGYWNQHSFMQGILYRYVPHDRWAFRGNLLYGKVEQLNDKNANRNLSFSSPLYEISGVVEFNFFPFSEQSSYFISPYIFCGLGAFRFNPRAKLNGTWYDLRDFRTEGQDSKEFPDRTTYSLFSLTMPFGVGLKWNLNRSICLGLEWGLRKTWTDYLDDVSTTYVDKNILLNDGGETAVLLANRSKSDLEKASGTLRGDPSRKDWYGFIGVQISFKIVNPNKKYRCNN